MPEKKVPSKPRPPEVEKARLAGDTTTLSRLGKAGGIKSGKTRREKRDWNRLCEDLHRNTREELLAEAHENAYDPNVRVGWDDDFKP